MGKWFLASICLGLAIAPIPSLLSGEGLCAPLIIELETEDSRQPLYLAPFTLRGTTSLPQPYLEKLEATLQFDLSHNGITVCVEKKTTTASTPYQLHVEIEGSTAKVSMAATRTTSTRLISTVPLTGHLQHDRRQMHLVADAVHKAITGIPGLATTHILYTVRKPLTGDSWTSDIWECDYDGASPHPLCQNGSYCMTPVYVPPKEGHSATAYLYVSYEAGLPKIYLSPLQGGKQQRLCSLRGNQLMPAMSRQRHLLAFISDLQGNPDLFIQPFSPEEGLQGQAIQLYITPRPATQASPTFSPDGSKVAFVSNRGGSPRIYILTLPSGKLTPQREALLISRCCSENSAPSWAPDGTKIAYCSLTDGVRQIWIYDTENDRERQLTYGPKHKENPSWAPNSRVIVYNTNDNNDHELYLVALAHPLPVKISSAVGEKRFPSWEPR